jgi:hypothetical protein
MQTSGKVKAEYDQLEIKYRQLRKEKMYDQAQEVLEKLTELVVGHPLIFDEVEDRVRVLSARKVMSLCEMKRLQDSSLEIAQLLRQAADWSTPSVCEHEKCARLDPQLCISRRAQLSRRQARMCVEKLSNISDALKIEASFATRKSDIPDLQLALAKRREAATIHSAVVKLDGIPGRQANQRYLEYWQFVTEGQLSLHEGNFGTAKEWFQKAVNLGARLDPIRCFPNFFRDVKELQAHTFFIDAVDHVRQGMFREASELFQVWLNLFPERAYKKRYDNIKIYELACGILDQLPKGTVQPSEWDALFNFLEDANPSLPTWTLVKRLRELRALSASLHRQGKSSSALADEIKRISEEWILFVPDSALLGEDRTAGLVRPVNLPSFLNIFGRVNKDAHKWRELLVQNLKNLFLLLADYESKRYFSPPDEEKSLPALARPAVPSEVMSLEELTQIVLQYLRRRLEKNALKAVENAVQEIAHFNVAVNMQDFSKSVAIQKRIFETIRLWPHTIYVEDQKELRHYFWDEENPDFLARETVARRVWDRDPPRITFQGVQDLEKSEFYYLRPKWNIVFATERRIRHEEFHASDLPRWLSVFFENIFGPAKLAPMRFHDWILDNFDSTERLKASQLFGMLKYYSQDDVRDMWLQIYRKQLPPEAKTKNVAYFSMGHTGKSGSLNNYYFRQAISALGPGERSFEHKQAFREISVRNSEKERPESVIFLDDFIGGGVQAIRTLRAYFAEYDWLNAVPVYYCVLIGFEHGIQEIKKVFPAQIQQIFVAELLGEKNMAFSPQNPIWKCDEERKQMEEWASQIGSQVLTDRQGYDPERDKLGWCDSQALVAFHYNVPNNTLPIFWGEGKRNGKAWKPVLDRYD